MPIFKILLSIFYSGNLWSPKLLDSSFGRVCIENTNTALRILKIFVLLAGVIFINYLSKLSFKYIEFSAITV